MSKVFSKKAVADEEKAASYELLLEYKNYLKQRRLLTNKKVLLDYKGTKIALTKKQIALLGLVAKGFSNTKIAQELLAKTSAIKQAIYRLTRYLEKNLYEHVDRFSLIIHAQQMDLNDQL